VPQLRGSLRLTPARAKKVGALVLADEVLAEPSRCQIADLLDGAWFLEEVTGTGDNRELMRRSEHGRGLDVERDDLLVPLTDDQQGGCLHIAELATGEAGPAAAGDDCPDGRGSLCRGHQRGCRASARPEQAHRRPHHLIDAVGGGRAVWAEEPINRAGETSGQQPDVEAALAGRAIPLALLRGQEVEEHRREAGVRQVASNLLVSGRQPAAPRAVGEYHPAGGRPGRGGPHDNPPGGTLARDG